MKRVSVKQFFNIRKTFQFVFEASGKWAYANILFTIVNGTLPLLVIYFVKLIIDGTTAAAVAPDKMQGFHTVVFLIIVAAVVSILHELFSNLGLLSRENISQAANDHVFDILHKKSTELDLEYYENPEYHDMLYRARTEAPFRPARIVNEVMLVMQNLVSIALTAGLLLYFHWSIALILLVATIPGIFIRMRFAGHLFNWSKKSTPSERKSRYLNYLLTSERFVKEMRLFSLGSLLTGKFRDIRTQLRKERIDIIKKRTSVEIVTQVSAAIAIFGCYIFIVYQTIFGLITVGDMVLFFLAFQKGLSFLKELLANLAGLYEDNLFLTNLFDFLSLQSVIREPENPKLFPKKLVEGIEFKNVYFKYPMTSTNVLADVSMKINAGEIIAIVGDNGAGKTSLVKLICRLYDPSNGEIKIDNICIKNLRIADLRENISALFQDYSQYNLTFEDNVRFGNIHSLEDTSRLDDAVKKAGLEKVLNALPDKYQTTLGAVFENSKELSIGEWQKVALARAYYRDSQIIILDEPTSSMDALTENEFYENFKALAKGKTAVIISHRFSTVRMANRIFVMEAGKIIESGSHSELLALDGKYAKMFRVQAEKYL